jgi:8-oxo-dGTP pyrophosphatase MutT (NUDIX family)
MKVDAIRAALQGRTHKPATLIGGERFAAVAAVLRERAGRAEVLLIRRAKQEGDPWSGHMAFPGGRQDPADRDLLHTALRETEEEVGLRLDPEPHLVGRLDDVPAVARGQRIGLIIAPFVFAITGDPVLVPSPSEVDHLLWAPLSPLLRGERNTTHAVEHEGRTVELPGYDVDGRVVWGLTHWMLETLFEALDGTVRQRYSR